MLQISLKAARVNAGMRQKDVANCLGVDTATIINWEHGRTSPRIDQLQELCDLYSISINNIFLNRKFT